MIPVQEGTMAVPAQRDTEPLVAQLTEMAGLARGMEVLTTCATIAAAVAPLVTSVDCVEADPARAEALRETGRARHVWCTDFLLYPQHPEYDRVLIRPPDGAGAAHVAHAWGFLRPGGHLLAAGPGTLADNTVIPAP